MIYPSQIVVSLFCVSAGGIRNVVEGLFVRHRKGANTPLIERVSQNENEREGMTSMGKYVAKYLK